MSPSWLRAFVPSCLLMTLLTGCDGGGGSGGAQAPPSSVVPAGNTTPAASLDTSRAATPPDSGTAPGSRTVSEAAPDHAHDAVAGSQPPLAFDPSPLNFGYVPLNLNRRDSIKITNIGTAPVRLLQAIPTCACTTLTPVAGKVLQPGGSTDVEVILEGRSTAGPRKASIKFVAEGYAEPAEVDIAAEVSQAVRATPAILNLAGDDWFGHLVVESIDGSSFSILSTNGSPPVFVDYDPDIDEPTTRYVIEWDLRSHQNDINRLPHWYVIETDHPDAPILDAWVRHQVTIDASRDRKWRVVDRRILLPVLHAGEPLRTTVEVSDLGAEVIHAVRSLSKDLDVKLIGNVKASGVTNVTLEITPKAGFSGILHAKIEFISGVQSQRVDVIGKVSG